MLMDGTYTNPGEPNTQLKTMEELMTCDTVQDAGLEMHHVLALRLYTTSTYSSINNPMRNHRLCCRNHLLLLCITSVMLSASCERCKGKILPCATKRWYFGVE